MRINQAIDVELIARQYTAQKPFPHCVVDNLFPEEHLNEIIREIEVMPDTAWRNFDNDREKKWGLVYRRYVDTSLHRFLAFLSSPEVLTLLERITGIDGLTPDPYYGGGGVHYVPRGGYLAVHSDFNWHPKLRLDRRLNLLLYINEDWREEYGGCLELWDSAHHECQRRILPVFNRTVVFNTTDTSFHGHPEPLNCPATMARKSVSVYYYTNGRPKSEKSEPHETIFLDTKS